MYLYIGDVYIMYVSWIVDLQPPTVLPRHQAGPFITTRRLLHLTPTQTVRPAHILYVLTYETCITRQQFSENSCCFFFLSSARLKTRLCALLVHFISTNTQLADLQAFQHTNG